MIAEKYRVLEADGELKTLPLLGEVLDKYLEGMGGTCNITFSVGDGGIR